MKLEMARWTTQPTTTNLLPTSMATIGIMPIACIRTPNSSPPAKPPTTPLTNRPTIVKGWAWPARLATTPPSVRATSILGGQVRRYGGDHALFGDGDHITDDRQCASTRLLCPVCRSTRAIHREEPSLSGLPASR